MICIVKKSKKAATTASSSSSSTGAQPRKSAKGKPSRHWSEDELFILEGAIKTGLSFSQTKEFLNKKGFKRNYDSIRGKIWKLKNNYKK